jgi:hypothetical protein
MGFGKKVFGGVRKRTPTVSKAPTTVDSHDSAQLPELPHLHRAISHEHEVTESIPTLLELSKRNDSVMLMSHKDPSTRANGLMKRSASMNVPSLRNDALTSTNVAFVSTPSRMRFSFSDARIPRRRVDSWSAYRTQARPNKETSGQQNPTTLMKLPWSAQLKAAGVLAPEDFLGVPHSGLREYVRKLCVWKSENSTP